MIIVLDPSRAETAPTADQISYPRCSGTLRPWSSATPRRIGQLERSTRLIRPHRARCGSCHTTQVRLPADCPPRHADATNVVGPALIAKAQGQGYNAALLSHRLGDANVSSIDIDPTLVETAHARLADLGYRPHLCAGDGAAGFAQQAPYDRCRRISLDAVLHW